MIPWVTYTCAFQTLRADRHRNLHSEPCRSERIDRVGRRGLFPPISLNSDYVHSLCRPMAKMALRIYARRGSEKPDGPAHKDAVRELYKFREMITAALGEMFNEVSKSVAYSTVRSLPFLLSRFHAGTRLLPPNEEGQTLLLHRPHSRADAKQRDYRSASGHSCW